MDSDEAVVYIMQGLLAGQPRPEGKALKSLVKIAYNIVDALEEERQERENQYLEGEQEE